MARVRVFRGGVSFMLMFHVNSWRSDPGFIGRPSAAGLGAHEAIQGMTPEARRSMLAGTLAMRSDSGSWEKMAFSSVLAMYQSTYAPDAEGKPDPATARGETTMTLKEFFRPKPGTEIILWPELRGGAFDAWLATQIGRRGPGEVFIGRTMTAGAVTWEIVA